ncbi:hypothetical protein QBA35_17580 [Streptomyces bottropensis]|uniref:Uncharacterized protein n=1 Tax=Streptomyces bottropensis TaxID=42235 RepID=A0ABU8API3_9ACTN
MADRNQPYTAILLKFVVLVGLLYLPVLLFHLGTWVPFAGASAYLLWELARLHSAFGVLSGNENDRLQGEQDPARSGALGS